MRHARADKSIPDENLPACLQQLGVILLSRKNYPPLFQGANDLRKNHPSREKAKGMRKPPGKINHFSSFSTSPFGASVTAGGSFRPGEI